MGFKDSLQDNYRHKGLRKMLIAELKKKGIKDKKVLEVMGKIPRHFFFDDAFLEHAYEDKAFPIGQGQTISQPYTVAFQTELLKVKNGSKILEVGTGSGYQASILVALGADVYTIEYNQHLFKQTALFLPKMGFRPNFYCGDGSKGLPSEAPYDGIIVTAGAPNLPEALIHQLKLGGVLVIPVGDGKKQTMLEIVKTSNKTIRKKEHKHFSFVPLLGKFGWNKSNA